MKPIEFLSVVWPSEGIYCLAVPKKTADGKRTYYVHKTFTAIRDAVVAAKQLRDQHDVYFCMHTLKEHKRFNSEKLDWKTGEKGAYEVRVQQNTHNCRVFFFDLDVDPDKADKYASQTEALAGVKAFCMATKLPQPLLVNSGGGVHVYWSVSAPLPSLEWKEHARKLRALATHHGLRYDPSRTIDESSVLRVVGTFNRKKTTPREVTAWNDDKVSIQPVGEFLKAINDAVVRGSVNVTPGPAARIDSGLGSNLEVEYDGPPASWRSLIVACPQVQHYLKRAAVVSEPEWYHMLNLVRFVEDGRTIAHKVSAPYPDYTFEDTEKKITQLEDKAIKPTSCFKLAEVAGEQHCEGCVFAGKVKNPLMAARYKDPAPKPIVQQVVGPTTLNLQIPDAPYPFQRGKDGRITRMTTNKDGDEMHLPVLHHDLYPLRRITNKTMKVEQHLWRATLPRTGDVDFTLDADALYDKRKFVAAISNAGIFPDPSAVEHLQGYMIAYIAKLQQEADAESQRNHLGWTDKNTSAFIFPDKVLLADGSAEPAQLSKQAQAVAKTVIKGGTLERQVELMRFWADPGYIAAQFYITASLASPIFFASGHHGVIVNATGDAGASKSTSLYTAAAMWGDPEAYTINGTNRGMTANARNERLMTLANLPICVDEITKMDQREAVDLAMNVTQANGRVRLDQHGVEKPSIECFKSAIMLTTANSSLHNLLSTDDASGTAGSMRVFEMAFHKLGIHTKPEADAYLREIKQNFGHIGDAYMAYVVKNVDEVKDRVVKEMAAIDTEKNLEGSERFWSGLMAPTLVTCAIAYDLGLLPFDVAFMRKWLLERQLPFMRGMVEDSYTSPTGMLTDFLEAINAKMVIMGAPLQNNVEAFPLQTPHGELLAHYEVGSQTMWVLRKGFRDYCAKTGANSLKLVHELTEAKVIVNPRMKKVLGTGTSFAKAQSWCFQIDMSHDDMRGKIAVPEPKAEPGKLRVVDGGKA